MIGELSERIKLLKYDNYLWTTDKLIRGKTETKAQRCVFSMYGTASETTLKLTAYKKSGLQNKGLFEFGGKKYIVSVLTEHENKNYIEAVCGRVNIKVFTYQTFETEKDELNRVVKTADTEITFEGIVTEKYAKKITGAQDGDFYATETQSKIVITPLNIDVGTVISSDGDFVIVGKYEGEYLNEYEIVRKADV